MDRSNLKSFFRLLTLTAVDYDIMAQTSVTPGGGFHLSDDLNIFIRPTPRNLRKLANIIKRLDFSPKISVRLVNFLGKRSTRGKNKKLTWASPSKEELIAYIKVPVAEKLKWLDKVRKRIQ